MNTTTLTPASNDLKHSILAHDAEGNPMYIKIRLNDECKNGHQDFSITCDIYEKGKPKADRYFIMGGCCHEEIIKARPELKIFVDLHLCDYKGIPSYAVENGFYHLRNGFNNTKPEQPAFKAEFCNYYRITDRQFDVISQSQNQLQYALNLQKLGILEQWEIQANKAIKIMEEYTGKTFLIDSQKTQFHAPTSEQLKEEAEKQANGYYTPEATAQREQEKAKAEFTKLDKEEEKEINDIKTEYAAKRAVLKAGGKKGLDNCIYYTHSKTIAFNWRGYDQLSKDAVNAIIEKLQLPEVVKIENKA